MSGSDLARGAEGVTGCLTGYTLACNGVKVCLCEKYFNPLNHHLPGAAILPDLEVIWQLILSTCDEIYVDYEGECKIRKKYSTKEI